MRAALVLTVIGPDRPGLVETLATTVAAHGGNWQHSRMARLGGQFAGIVEVSVKPDQSGSLRTALAELGASGLRVTCDDAIAAPEVHTRAFRLEVVGSDREGIVRDIARALSGRGVNVEELDTGRESAPMSGELLFHAHALLHVPESVDVSQLRKSLEAIGDDLMVDVTLDPLAEH